MSAFLELLPRAIHDVTCGNETHQLVWSKGVITTLDHADPEGERALVALGGPRSRCIDVLDAWHRQRTSLRVLTLAPRGPADLLAGDVDDDALHPVGRTPLAPRALRRAMLARLAAGGVTSAYKSSVHFGWVRTVGGTAPPTGEGARRDDVDLMMLLNLGSGLPHRLVAEVLEAWQPRVDPRAEDDPNLPALRAALYGRAVAAVQHWLHEPRARVDVTLLADDEEPSWQRTDDGCSVALPWRWLTDVWAPGLTTAAGRFALAADLADGTVTLQTVGPDGGRPTPLRIELGSD